DPSIDAVIRKSDKPHLTNILLDRFIVIPEAKLLFCYIEKVKIVSGNQKRGNAIGGRWNEVSIARNCWSKTRPAGSDSLDTISNFLAAPLPGRGVLASPRSLFLRAAPTSSRLACV
ncbi:unnamed protein product, partial [Phaeothamnion confervicola]